MKASEIQVTTLYILVLNMLANPDFKDEIDNRKGYLQTELQLVNIEVLPDEELKLDQTEHYVEYSSTGQPVLPQNRITAAPSGSGDAPRKREF